MATPTRERHHELRLVRTLVNTLGPAHVVYLLAQVEDERAEVARARGDASRAVRCAHDAKLLGGVAIQLLE